MINTKTVKIDFTQDNNIVETRLRDMGINPLRWAVVDVDERFLTVSVSYE